MYRIARRDQTCGVAVPADKRVLPVVGSANRDPKHFPDAGRFDVARVPNPHLGAAPSA